MSYFKPALKILVFSALMTGSLGMLLLPYGFFFIPFAIGLSYYLFFIPILLITTLNYILVQRFRMLFMTSLLAAFSFSSILMLSAFIVYNERGTAEYFGNHLLTYVQLTFSAFLGFFVWRYLARILLFTPHERVLYSYRD